LPSWFVEDEDKNCKKLIPLPRKVIAEYRKKYDDINARPIKKVVEAEARKKKRVNKNNLFLVKFKSNNN
jgi:AdoMet-dependent rRNA methyltransferase SPB1